MDTSSELAFDPDTTFTPLILQSLSSLIEQDPTSACSAFCAVKTIAPIRDVSAMISLTGPVSIMLLFVFDHALAWRVMQHEIKNLAIEESEDVMDAVLAEMANVIGGNATAVLAEPGKEIHLSLPLIMRAVKLSPGITEVVIQKCTMQTHDGAMDLYCISPAIVGSIVAT